MKKIIIYILQISVILLSCNVKKDFTEDNLYSAVDFDSIQSMKIRIYKNGRNEEFNIPLNQETKLKFKEIVKIDGFWKFENNLIIINYKNKIIDSIWTNGITFKYHNCYYMKKDKNNLFSEEIMKNK